MYANVYHFSKRRHEQKCSIKQVFSKLLQYWQENTCVGVFFNKIAGLQICNFFLKKRLQHRCSPVSISKFLKTLILKSISQRVGDSRWWGSLTTVPAGNKAKHLSSVNHTTKTNHHHHHHHRLCWKTIESGGCYWVKHVYMTQRHN